MGQKINPIGFRLETVKNSPQWQSSWYAGTKKYATYLLEDKNIRDYVQKKFYSAGIVSIRIERSVKKMKLTLVGMMLHKRVIFLKRGWITCMLRQPEI